MSCGRRKSVTLWSAISASFAISSGAVIWVYMSEIFPNAVRVKGQALGSTTLWVVNGLISQIFPWMAAKSASLPFVIFASLMAIQFIVTLAFYPETKGYSLEELESRLR
jgi:MFS transporter, SP family, arabinose:H+ symporter